MQLTVLRELSQSYNFGELADSLIRNQIALANWKADCCVALAKAMCQPVEIIPKRADLLEEKCYVEFTDRIVSSVSHSRMQKQHFPKWPVEQQAMFGDNVGSHMPHRSSKFMGNICTKRRGTLLEITDIQQKRKRERKMSTEYSHIYYLRKTVLFS